MIYLISLIACKLSPICPTYLAGSRCTWINLDSPDRAKLPFPFAGDRLTLVCEGRYIGPLPAGCDRAQAGAILRALPVDHQTYELVPAR
jgi:hypothetical protein